MAVLSESSSAPPPQPEGPPPHARDVRVLVVDDEPALRRGLARTLMAQGFEVLTAEDGHAALALLESSEIDVMLVDLLMPRMGGMDLLARVKAERGDVEAIMMAAFADVDAAVAAVEHGAYDFLTKPFASNEVVVMAVSKAAERKRLLDRMRHLEQRLEEHEKLGELVGDTPRMREVHRLALGVAPTSSTVLVLGESGTGKELIARTIHQRSSRASRPFFAVDCSAIPAELVESELFGHVKGAFGGAPSARVGLFEAADEATLFLDEVGELPLAAQARLLRVLQEGEVKRVGSNDVITVDTRVVAATTVDLRSEIAAGRFREDLYYRLNVIAIHVPPLRQRRDDVPLLAYHFLRKHARRLSRDVSRVSVEAMRVLREQRWPGNVRELESAIEHAVVMARKDTIVPGDLPFGREAPDDDADPIVEGAEPGDAGAVRLGPLLDLPYAEAKRRALDEFERAFLRRVLKRSGGNVSEAARQSGLDRSNFRRALKRAKVK